MYNLQVILNEWGFKTKFDIRFMKVKQHLSSIMLREKKVTPKIRKSSIPITHNRLQLHIKCIRKLDYKVYLGGI